MSRCRRVPLQRIEARTVSPRPCDAAGSRGCSSARDQGPDSAAEDRCTNHVFRAGDVVVRVAPLSADVSSQVALARWLGSEGFPVAAPLADAELVGGAKLSLWEYIHADERRPVDFGQLGEIVARLHRVAPDRMKDVVALPFCGDAAWLTARPGTGCTAPARPDDQHDHQRCEQPHVRRRGSGSDAVLARRSRRSVGPVSVSLVLRSRSGCWRRMLSLVP